MKKIRILIIEDNRLLREGIIKLINEYNDLKVVADLDYKGKLDSKILTTKPDIMLVDLGLYNKNSLELVRITKNKFPEINIIVMAIMPLQEDIFEFVKAGASGFIMKDAQVRNFLSTIRSVYKGNKILPNNLTCSLFSQIVSDAVSDPKKSKLIRSFIMSKRERQVIALVADGYSNKEIGDKLFLSPFTVKSHIHNILEKLAMHNRVEIAKFAKSEEGLNELRNTVSLFE
ncbi:MAG: response regulator transcription factor [Ignavibacteria bacterium]|nr:response regulator transcription factor [Ignavibacteria bacterium]